MRFLGIDYGAARIGLATADDDSKLAQPHGAVNKAGLKEFIKTEGPFDAVVVGLPRGLDGQDTPQTLAVRHFTDDVLGPLNIEPVFQDEAGTSGVAESRLKETGKKFEKGDIDAEAASIILQDYLDTL
jgi:putative Holliday junction resolvase